MAGRSRAALAAKNNPQLEDRSWHIQKDCQYCGRAMVVNNYDDRKPRTPRMLGLIICAWCDPRVVEDRWKWRDKAIGERPRVLNRDMYRVIMSTYLLRSLSFSGPVSPEKWEKLQRAIAKFWVNGEPVLHD